MNTNVKQLPAKPINLKKRINYSICTIVVIGLIIWSFTGMPMKLSPNFSKLIGSIFSGLFHPEWKYVYNGTGEDLLTQLWQTLCIAFLGTFISAIISIPFAFWAANTKHKKWFVSRSGHFVLTAIRAFPEIVLALMFIKAVGPGAEAGVLALGFHSVGMLAKLFSEAIENLGEGANEAITAVGGSKFNIAMFATLPNLMPALVSNTLYRFDVSVRSASILGLVGAGGIGTPLMFALNTRDWNRVGIILLGIIVMVVIIDWISGWIRKKLV